MLGNTHTDPQPRRTPFQATPFHRTHKTRPGWRVLRVRRVVTPSPPTLRRHHVPPTCAEHKTCPILGTFCVQRLSNIPSPRTRLPRAKRVKCARLGTLYVFGASPSAERVSIPTPSFRHIKRARLGTFYVSGLPPSPEHV